MALPKQARQRLRQQRERILDLLEEEERQEQLREEQKERQEHEEIVRKRKAEAENGKARLIKAKELQKKMGRALLRNMAPSKEQENQKGVARVQGEEDAQTRNPSSPKKKTVNFADSHDDSSPTTSSVDASWGDVTAARLRSANRPTLMSQAESDKHTPMKRSVVERLPVGPRTLPKPAIKVEERDSDDESEGDASDNGDGAQSDQESILEEDDFDFDFAQHQREIALEYHRKRTTIGEETAAAMRNHSHESGERHDKLGEPDMLVPDHAKHAISQFRANRIASAYNASTSSSTSLGASVLPASSTRTLQQAFRAGKLDSDGRLIGGEADSASEDEEPGLQEVLELLKKSEVYNIGPDGKYLHTIPPSSGQPNPAGAPPVTPLPAEAAELNIPPSLSGKPKTSRFKVSRQAAGRPSMPLSTASFSSNEALSPSVTPVSYDTRSSPKVATPTSTPTVIERLPPSTESQPGPQAIKPSPSAILQGPVSPFSMIVESPSFPTPRERPSRPPTVVASPSPPGSARRPDRPPTIVGERVPTTEGAEKKISRFKAERM